MNKVLIIGKHRSQISLLDLPGSPNHQDDQLELDHAHEVNRPCLTGYAFVAQCNGVPELMATLTDFVDRHGRINILDIFDHGAPGGIHIGDPVLFRHDGTNLVTGSDTAKNLACFLTETAQLRLLGCGTGAEETGRLLLLMVSSILGQHRIVFGAMDRVISRNFTTERGFTQERELLFSSLGALDSAAPNVTSRTNQIGTLPNVVFTPDVNRKPGMGEAACPKCNAALTLTTAAA